MSTMNRPTYPSRPRRSRPPLLAVAAGVVGLIVLLAIVYVVIRFFLPAGSPKLALSNPPGMETGPSTQQALVSSYGWANKPTGAARIPVDRAMEIIATSGFPTLVAPPSQETPQPTAAGAGGGSAGAALFTSLGCIGCHQAADSPVAPTLHGIYGNPVQLEGGQTVTADDAYIRESILDPTAKVVKGFNPIMPSFQGKVTDAQIQQLIDYIKSLK